MNDLIEKLSNHFTRIIPRNELRGTELDWGDNGIGDRFAKKQYNYGLVYSNKTTKIYSENDDEIPVKKLDEFIGKLTSCKTRQVVGIYVFSKKITNISRIIRADIKKIICSNPCVVCGSNSDIVCDHKNDLYNDARVLNTKTQLLSDFQPLCNHCNLQKRQVCKTEIFKQKIYSAKNIPSYRIYSFEFPWEKKVFDKNDIKCKEDTYWNDPVEFNIKLLWYIRFIFVMKEIKNKYYYKQMLTNLTNLTNLTRFLDISL